MKILQIHNRYQLPGGEDVVVGAESILLKRKNHTVDIFLESNSRANALHPLKVTRDTIWSRQTQKKLSDVIHSNPPDIVHFHNIFYRISPSAYYTVKEFGLPIIQTLHNYRLVCPGALLMRKEKVCEKCLGKFFPWPSVFHGCWRGSRKQTTVVTAMLTFHRVLRTLEKKVDLYIALTEFARKKFIEGGIPAEKIIVKPNFVDTDPGEREHAGDYFLFVGRLSGEKGLPVLLQAWKKVIDIPLKIIGDGPLKNEIHQFINKGYFKIELLGNLPRDQVFHWMKNSIGLIFPSVWYETFGMVAVEAFACGLPVIASRLGAMGELIENYKTGLLFQPSNSDELAEAIQWAVAHPQKMREMGKKARKMYEEKYTAEKNYQILMDIYQKAIELNRKNKKYY